MLKEKFMCLYIFDGDQGGSESGNSAENALDGQLATDEKNGENGFAADNNSEQEISEAEIYDKFVKEHKSEHEKRIRGIVNERLKGSRQLRSEYDSMKSVLDVVMSRYEAKDINDLKSKLDSDSDYYRVKAAEKGMSEEAYKEFEKMQLMLREHEQSERERQKAQFWKEIDSQCAELKKTYPDFDFDREMQNGDFEGMIRAGLPVEHAYKLVNFDTLVNGAVTQARKTASAQTAEAIRSGKNRANENGTGAEVSARPTGYDFSKLTSKQMDELERRALRGERISFVKQK